MPVPFCHMCQRNTQDHQRYGDSGLSEGIMCPICHRPTCRHHLGTVRWRWKKTGKLDSARICLDCKNSYQHRYWDTHNRDWIS